MDPLSAHLFAARQLPLARAIKTMSPGRPLVLPLDRLRMTDVDEVGGKNASLGEMISQLAGAGIRVPGGFATTAAAYRDFMAHNGLATRIAERIKGLDVEDVRALAKAGAEIRRRLGMNQEQFWTQIGVTQSGGSR